MVREAKQDRNLRFLEFFQPQPQPCVFSTSNDSEHLLTISYKSYMYTYLLQKWFRCLKTSANASPQRIYIYKYIYTVPASIGLLPANHQHLPICHLSKLPRCPIAITDIPQDAFQLSKVHGCHAIAIVGLVLIQRMFFCFFFRRKVAPKGEFWESQKSEPFRPPSWWNKVRCMEWMQNIKI